MNVHHICKNRILNLILALVIMAEFFLLQNNVIYGADSHDSGKTSYIQGVLKDSLYNINYDNDLLINSGTTNTDWIFFTLGCYRRLVTDAHFDDLIDQYLTNINEYVSSKYRGNNKLHRIKATEWHRIALAVTACGGNALQTGLSPDNKQIDLIADGTYNCLVGDPWRQGINGGIFALITLDSNNYQIPDNATYTRNDIIDYILSKELAEGGFALTEDEYDVDITAMAIQALAKYMKERSDVGEAVNRSLQLLSNRFKETGDFGNAESNAQVLLALTALKKDVCHDQSFISDTGHTLIDAVMNYYDNSSLMFRHVNDGTDNFMATTQCLYALCGWLKEDMKGGWLYDFTNSNDEPGETVKPAETVKPVETAKPAETVKPIETVKPAETVKPEETIKPTETVKPAETIKPTETVKPEETIKSTETVKPAETIKQTETVKQTEKAKPAATAKAVKTYKEVNAAKAKKTDKPVQTDRPVKAFKALNNTITDLKMQATAKPSDKVKQHKHSLQHKHTLGDEVIQSEDAVIASDKLNRMLGWDVNLQLKCVDEACNELYSVTVNGTDISEELDNDVDLSLILQGEHEGDIAVISDDAFVFTIGNTGKSFVTSFYSFNTGITDGEYLLMKYCLDEKPEFVNKVKISKGLFEGIIYEAGEYFLCKNVRMADKKENVAIDVRGDSDSTDRSFQTDSADNVSDVMSENDVTGFNNTYILYVAGAVIAVIVVCSVLIIGWNCKKERHKEE